MRLFLLEPSVPHCAARNTRHCCRSFLHVAVRCARTGHRRKLEASGHNFNEAESSRSDGHHNHGRLHLCILRHGLLCDISEVAPLGPLVTEGAYFVRRGVVFPARLRCFLFWAAVECELRQGANVCVWCTYIYHHAVTPT